MDEFGDCDDVRHGSKYKHERTIVHIDLDCFYAQVEMLKNPDLSTKPVGIKQQHYVITSNYVAREYGIKKCMLITEALALCPKLIIVNGEDLHDYRIMSTKVTEVIRQFSSKVEKLGLDENFVDVSDLVQSKLTLKEYDRNKVIGHIYKNEIEYNCTCGCKERLTIGSYIASEIRARIKKELGMTCCAGVGHNKLLSKLVCPTHKPNQQTTVFPCSAVSLVSNLNSVRAIPGIGRKTSDILDALGINSVCDAQHSSIDVLEKHVGRMLAHWIKSACFGVDDSEVKESDKQQVIGLEEASKKISSMQDVCNRLNSLAERGMVLLREDGRYPTTIRVAVRKYSHEEEYSRQRQSKQCAISPSLFRTSTAKDQIVEIALSLFKKVVDHTKPFHLTLIGLSFTKFQEELPAKSSLLKFLKNNSVDKFSAGQSWSDDKDISSCVPKPLHVKDTKTVKDNVIASIKTPFGDIDESVLSELPEDIRSEILQMSSFQVNEPGTSASQKMQNSVMCPLGIDQRVFNELPYEIQIELISDSNKTSSNTVTKASSSSKKQNSILKYLEKK